MPLLAALLLAGCAARLPATRVIAVESVPEGAFCTVNQGDAQIGPTITTPGAVRVVTSEARIRISCLGATAARTDGQRYYAANHRILPPEHGLIVLPPTSPGGDPTYIWPSPASD
jgi:hypothetical protein